MAETDQSDVAALTVQLLSAYLANNTVAHTDIAELVRTTKAALIEEAVLAAVEAETPSYTPAVSVRRSLASPDHILSLIDGKPYKTLKRHLTSNGLTPDGYRARYGLPASYPLVAPGFAEQRRAIAEKIGLGRRPATTPEVAAQDKAQTPKAPAAAKKPTIVPAAKKPQTPSLDTARAPGTIAAEEVASPPAATAAPKALPQTPAPKSAAPKTAGSRSAGVRSAAPKKVATKPAAKATKAAKPESTAVADTKAEPESPFAAASSQSSAKTTAAAKTVAKPAKKPAEAAAKPASSTAAKAKPYRDKLGLFREVAEAAAVRDSKRGKGKNSSAAEAATPAESADMTSQPAEVSDGSASKA